jgi:hypothetical protein
VKGFTNFGLLHNCIIGNKILQIRINNNELLFDLLDITEDVRYEVRTMVPIHFLVKDNSYDYFSVGNSITISGYNAYKYTDNSDYDFSIYTNNATISKTHYVPDMNSVFIYTFESNNGVPHISSIVD